MASLNLKVGGRTVTNEFGRFGLHAAAKLEFGLTDEFKVNSITEFGSHTVDV